MLKTKKTSKIALIAIFWTFCFPTILNSPWNVNDSQWFLNLTRIGPNKNMEVPAESKSIF